MCRPGKALGNQQMPFPGMRAWLALLQNSCHSCLEEAMDGAPVAAASAPAAPAFRAFHSHGMWTEGFILP